MTQNRGRRVALPPPERVARGLRARLNMTAVLAVVLPLLTVGALSLVRQADPVDTREAPQETALALSVLTCPSSLAGARQVSVASATGLGGTVDVARVGEDPPAPLDIEAGLPATATPGRGAVVVRAVDDLAPALLAARDDEGPASASCVSPRPEQWFTGLGAAARHSSVLELVNPDAGPAVADITVIGPRGPVDAPSLRGITVPGASSLRLDLAREIPVRGELSAHVVVSRGRLGVFAADSYDQLGRGAASVDWVASQEPSEDLLLLGLATGGGSRDLVLANDGDDEVRAVVRVVTKDSAFRPEGLQDVRVPPQSVTRVPLSAILGAAVTDGAVGIHVEAAQPVTATLRSFVGGDLSHTVPLASLAQPTQSILPPGRATVLLSSSAVGSAEVVARRADGSEKVREFDLVPGRTVVVRLPRNAALVEVTPSVDVRSSVVVARGGAAVIGLRELVRTDLVPALRPALP
jgi:Family of unknown function (DUF5719)